MARIAAAARTVASLLLSAAILGAAAAALITWAGSPLPNRWPTTDELTAFADQPLDHLPTKLALAIMGWLLWLLLVLSLGLEAWVRLSRRPSPIILPRPMRVLAAGMLGTSVVALTTAAHASPPAASPTITSNPPNPHNADGPAPVRHAISPVHSPAEPSNPYGAQHQHQADESPSIHTHRGIDIPGGWIVWPVAAGVLAATAITLLRSRTTLAPASALLRAIRATQHLPSDPNGEEPATAVGDDIAALEQDATAAPPLAIGLHGTAEIGLDSLPSSGVSISGPGSTDALRGILAAAATSTGTTLVIPAQLLHTLADTLPPLPGVTATKDADAAMHILQMEIHRRYTHAEKPDTASVEHQHPPLLMLIEPTPGQRRLAALAELGSQYNIRVVVAGPWFEGPAWVVDRHGHTTSGTTAIGRLNILNAEALTQIIQALQPAAEPTVSPVEAPAAAASPTPFHLHILGTPRLATTSNPDLHIRRSGSRQIAVYLALHPNGASKDQLLENIFGHMTMTSATTSLHSCLYDLRRLLTIDDHSALVRLDDLYHLDPQLVTVDWWQLLHHLHRGNLAEATAHYTGHIADGHTWDWLPEHRQNARHLIADTHAALARTAAAPDQSLSHALAGINIDPYSTPCYEAAIDAAARMGQPDRAQAFREEMTRRLAPITDREIPPHRRH